MGLAPQALALAPGTGAGAGLVRPVQLLRSNIRPPAVAPRQSGPPRGGLRRVAELGVASAARGQRRETVIALRTARTAAAEGTPLSDAEKLHLVEALDEEQDQLDERLAAAKAEVDDAMARLHTESAAANISEALLSSLRERVQSLEQAARGNLQSGTALQKSQASVVDDAAAIEQGVNSTNSMLSVIGKNLETMHDVADAGKQTNDNLDTLSILEPRLEALDHKLGLVEHRISYGNVTEAVDRAVGQQMTLAVEDVSRSMAMELDE